MLYEITVMLIDVTVRLHDITVTSLTSLCHNVTANEAIKRDCGLNFTMRNFAIIVTRRDVSDVSDLPSGASQAMN